MPSKVTRARTTAACSTYPKAKQRAQSPWRGWSGTQNTLWPDPTFLERRYGVNPNRSIVWFKRAALIAALGLFVYGIDHWPWMSDAVVWGLRGLFAGWSWIISSEAFRETKTPWQTAGKAALWIIGVSVLIPFYFEEWTSEERIAFFVWTIALMGIPTIVAAYRHRARFPNPDSAAQ